ncbi:MAG: hypothetical protein U1A27_04080 [Phycisphaerae bacterium]
MVVRLRAASPSARPTRVPRSLDAERRGALWLAALVAAFAITRLLYYFAFGVRFDATGLNTFLQLIDPLLLRTRLAESLWYLRDQPPLFNLFVGIVLKLAPTAAVGIFHGLYLAMGLALSLCLYRLALELGATPALAGGVALAWTLHPGTVLYENLLLYEYPLALLLVSAALMLRRYLVGGRRLHAAALCALLAAAVLMRGTFHWVWFVTCVAGVLALRVRPRRVLLAATVPLALVGGVYLKHFALYHDLVFGSVFADYNLAMMTVYELPTAERLRLYQSGELPQAYGVSMFGTSARDYADIIPPSPPAGVPLLDQPIKSTGAPNFHHRDLPQIAAELGRGAWRVLRDHPETYRSAVEKNVRRYFLPVDQAAPIWDPHGENRQRLAPLLTLVDRACAWQPAPGRVAWFTIALIGGALLLTLPSALRGLLAILRTGDALRAGVNRPELGVVLFCGFNVLYVAGSTILLSAGDHSRYRFSTMPLVAVLAVVAARNVAERVTTWRLRRRATVTPPGQPARV